jgi:hypothetical protein
VGVGMGEKGGVWVMGFVALLSLFWTSGVVFSVLDKWVGLIFWKLWPQTFWFSEHAWEREREREREREAMNEGRNEESPRVPIEWQRDIANR